MQKKHAHKFLTIIPISKHHKSPRHEIRQDKMKNSLLVAGRTHTARDILHICPQYLWKSDNQEELDDHSVSARKRKLIVRED